MEAALRYYDISQIEKRQIGDEYVFFFSFGILPMLIQLFHKVVIVVLSLISSVVSRGC